MQKILLVLLVIALVVSSGPVLAKDGFYMGMDLGVAIAPDMDVKTGGLDDWSRSDDPFFLCDASLYPEGARDRCRDTPFPWGPMDESFDGGTGILAGVALGYRMGNFRAEGEYFFRNANHDSTDVPTEQGYEPRNDPNFEDVEDGVDDVLSHNFFANLYYDFHSDSKLTPYLGIGIGFAKVSVEYRTYWERKTDTRTGEISGKITSDSAKLSDVLFGYQALAGVDYQVSDPVTIGLKFRWADYGEFEDESAYDRLRGHASVAGKDKVPVTYYVKTDDIQFWGVSLNMKYQF